jgi:hypothetical protein
MKLPPLPSIVVLLRSDPHSTATSAWERLERGFGGDKGSLRGGWEERVRYEPWDFRPVYYTSGHYYDGLTDKIIKGIRGGLGRGYRLHPGQAVSCK